MRTSFPIILASACAIVAGCQKSEFKQLNSGVTKLTICTPDASKTAIGPEGERSVTWSEGDVIAWNGTPSAALSSEQGGKSSAEFTWENVMNYPADLLYPASFYKDASTITLPATQARMGGVDGIATNTLPMCGFAEDGTTSPAMKYLGAIVSIKINKGDDDSTISYITFKGNDGEQVSGDFSIDYDNGTLTGIEDSTEGQSVRTLVGATLSSNPTVCNIVVPAGVYSNGFTIRIVDKEGHYMEKAKASSCELEAGSVTSFPAITFEPTGTQIDVVITNAAELVAFAQAWNAGEFDYEPYVQLANDIEFDDQSNADFLAAEGIGQEEGPDGSTNYFNGIFDGNGKTIKYWKNYSLDGEGTVTASTPLFPYTGNGATIKDLTIDSSCDIMVGNGTFGTIAGRHKGIIDNVTVKSMLNFKQVSGTAYVGGIVGRVYGGSVTNCTNEGGITMATDGEGTTRIVRVGGIAGTLEDDGAIENCTLSQPIVFGTQSGGTGPQNPNAEMHVGGIAGNVISGSVESCLCDASMDLRGKSGFLYAAMIAGKIDADGKITNCKISSTPTIYVRMTANATIKVAEGQNHSGEPTFCAVGGVAGYNAGSIESTPCKAAKVTSNHGAAYQYCGGIAGYNCGAITSSDNAASIVGPTQYTGVINYHAGGIAGYTATALSDLTNSGALTWSPAALVGTDILTFLGGCVGESEASLSGLANSGDITLGKTDWTAPAGMVNMNIGGIVATVASEVEVSDCENSAAKIQIVTPGTYGTGSPNAHVAGIAANVGAGTTVSGCKNTGLLYNGISKNGILENTSQKTGGIVAYANGEPDSKVIITNCENLATSGMKYYGARGFLAGIVAWADNTEIKSCTSTMSQAGYLGWYSAGIAAKLVASKVDDCTARCDIAGRYVLNGAAGGITAAMDASSKVLNSTYFGNIAVGDNQSTSATRLGGIAGTSEEGSEISGCSFGGTIKSSKVAEAYGMTLSDICSDTNFTEVTSNKLITE